MAITAGMVKELREMTGAGMMDCKKALTETNGDMNAAVDYLRKKGQAAAQKRASKIAAEGLVTFKIADDFKSAAIVEVNSETDFVAKNEIFREFVNDVAAQALATKAADMEAFMAEPWNKDPQITVNDALVEKIALIHENLKIRRFEKITTEGYIGGYIHGGGRIGVLVELDAANDSEPVRDAAKDVAMQVAALNAQYISRADVSDEYLAHEKEILMEKAMKEANGKPANIVEKMVEGRLSKELKDICLLDQIYFRDNEQTVGKFLKKATQDAGTPITVKKFIRFETGEGIEKKEENFAEEVAAQMRQ
ncbi:MAG: translation elongation factor Ts [Clostridiales bacterium]|nr:translation elongation factor Ts [Clostridiales bacterium]